MDFLSILSVFGLINLQEPARIPVKNAIDSLYQDCATMNIRDETHVLEEDVKALASSVHTLLEHCDTASLIELSTLDRIRKQAACVICLGEVTPLNPLPEVQGELTKEEMLRIFYVCLKNEQGTPMQQDARSCAYFVSAFAASLNTLIKAHKPLSSKNIQELTRVWMQPVLQESLKKAGLNRYELVDLTYKKGIEYFYALEIQDPENPSWFMSGTYSSPNGNRINCYKGNFEPIFTSIKSVLQDCVDVPLAVHFACLFPYNSKKQCHWNLVSIIKPAYKKPFLLILDSYDFRFPLYGNERYVAFLYKNMVQPFYRKK